MNEAKKKKMHQPKCSISCGMTANFNSTRVAVCVVRIHFLNVKNEAKIYTHVDRNMPMVFFFMQIASVITVFAYCTNTNALTRLPTKFTIHVERNYIVAIELHT